MWCRIRNNSWYYANPTRYVTYFTSLCFVNHITVATIIYITQRSSKYHMQLFNDEALIQITYVVWLRSVPPDNICCLYYEVRLYLYHLFSIKEKNHNPPPLQVKWSFPYVLSITCYCILYILYICISLYLVKLWWFIENKWYKYRRTS
jgi:hypothetical protein